MKKSLKKITCPVCATEYEGEFLVDACPCCDWIYLEIEDEIDPDEEDDINGTSFSKAKQNFAMGLDIWGDPIEK